MLDAGTPIAKVAKIVRWSTATRVRTAARYGHVTLNGLWGAVESISSTTMEEGDLANSTVLEATSATARAN